MRRKHLVAAAAACLIVALPIGLSALRRVPDYRTPRAPFQGSPAQRARTDADIEKVGKETLDELIEGVAQLEDYWVALSLYQGPDFNIRGRFSLLFASRRLLRILDHLDSLPEEDAKQECRRIREAWLDIHRQSISEALGQYAAPPRPPTRKISMVGAHMALCASAFLTAHYCGLAECREWMRIVDRQSEDLISPRNVPITSPKSVVLLVPRFARLQPLTKISLLNYALLRDTSVPADRKERAIGVLRQLDRHELAITAWNAKVGAFDLGVINAGGWPDFAMGKTRLIVNYEWGSAVIGNRTLMTDEDLQRDILREFENALP